MKRESQVTSVRALKLLWPRIREFKAGLLLGVALVLGTTAIEVATPWVIGRVVDVVTDSKASRDLIFFSALFLVLSVVRTGFEIWQAYVIQRTGQKITHKLRCDVFSRILNFPVSRYDKDTTGRLLTRVINDVRSLGELFSSSMSVLLLDVAVIIGTTIGMLVLDWKLSVAILLPFPFAIVSVRYFGNRISEIYREVRFKLAEINSFLGENVMAIGTIQRLGAERARSSRFRSISEDHFRSSMKSVRFYSLIQPVTNTLNGTTVATLVIYGGFCVMRGELTLGTLVAFLGYVKNIFQPIRDLIEKYNTFLSAGVSAERLAAVFEEESEHDADVRIPVDMNSESLAVVFENVSFHYPLRNELALSDVSFVVPPKKSFAIVGATGSGKSTLIRLLLRFYDPDRGEISVGGLPLRNWPKDALRRRLGVVHQESYLIEGSLRENLTLGKAGFDESTLIHACRTAQLWDLIVPRGGLEFKILEGGSNLSSGEKQLISLARILVFDPPVLILDEATSSIDSVLEKKLLSAIQKTLSGRTSIVIAHRLSTIRHSDSILVLGEGRILEQGNFDQLIEAKGAFEHFYRLYSRKESSATMNEG